jgi:D-erythrose 4-phosphate dehydrogenase
MPINIAINGYGRIGRCVLRALFEAGLQDTVKIVAINELADDKTIAHLTKYDSTHGKFLGDVSLDNGHLSINQQRIRIFHEQDINNLPWHSLKVDLVLECTGSFTDRKTAQLHIKSGARRVLFSQPAENDVDATIVFGINDASLKASDTIISSASCTTNCIVPVIDAYHHTDLRKTRSAMQSIIPVDTGLARGIDRILPHLAGRFEAQAMRVPTLNVSAIDLSVVVATSVDVATINTILQTAASHMPEILGFSTEPLASCDFNHDARSGIIDASQTRVAGKNLVKVLTWFDNEWGFANRMLDVVGKIQELENLT